MVETAEKHWYVLHTYSGYENRVKANLESRAQSMNMEDFIFRVVVPEDEEMEKKNGKEVMEKKKTFPGYVLVEMVMTDESWFVVRNTPGVTGFVGSHGAGSKPAPLLDSEVAQVLHSMGMSTRHEGAVDFEPGESVTIIDGAFSGLVGKVTEVNKEKLTLKVNITMFERETSAELNFDQVDKI
ncbi:transcription termination/antitermination protein NusG [Schleiferilactobacillus harbinensis]|jgi:transcriptional antiterminator NusG|nr:transcription termination/antitermination protein NusG [Schleiferilactobacillus harbinensis]MCI1688046.1 transcription termination/antitermination protein NusG [Schleiferilactobacillus harbinensis]MCI1782410.1 transcription termination/antitermination protein NusG [Schleiferilactobacillus harbinensis]MCI1852074.1 transcription termination/antitermination protein NusG [Schleiferilactobacillus harbinensis]MCT2909851.1 transcription termination/antitermination protein NusG [Schleiferilactobacil